MFFLPRSVVFLSIQFREINKKKYIYYISTLLSEAGAKIRGNINGISYSAAELREYRKIVCLPILYFFFLIFFSFFQVVKVSFVRFLILVYCCSWGWGIGVKLLEACGLEEDDVGEHRLCKRHFVPGGPGWFEKPTAFKAEEYKPTARERSRQRIVATAIGALSKKEQVAFQRDHLFNVPEAKSADLSCSSVESFPTPVSVAAYQTIDPQPKPTSNSVPMFSLTLDDLKSRQNTRYIIFILS